MPTLFKMSSEKEATDSPSVVIAETRPTASPSKKKKYVIIAVSAVLSAAIVLAAILIGMHFFTEAQKEIVKDVTSDPNENVVQYHVSNPQQESWIVNDFNKDIQVVKIQSERETNCYISALNRSNAMDPSKVINPGSSDIKDASSLVYKTSGTPISDTSFLSKKARDMCKGVSVYWVYPMCLDKNSPNTDALGHNHTGIVDRKKREPPYFYQWNLNPTTVCIAGCCKYLCACKISYHWIVDSTKQIYCHWFLSDCNDVVTFSPVAYGCYNGPTGLVCPTKFPATWPTC